MYHQPVRKLPKKPEGSEQDNRNHSAEKPNFIQKNRELQSRKKIQQKPATNTTLPKPPSRPVAKTIPQKVEHLEKAVEKLAKGTGDPNLQRLLLEEIKGIKSELRQIKQQIGLNPNTEGSKFKYEPDQEQEEIEENIAHLHQREEPREFHNPNSNSKLVAASEENIRVNASRNSYEEPQQAKKELIDIGKIQPYMKEFKLEATKLLLPLYRGYHKKSSKPVVIKYCSENETMDPLIGLYEKLWKNIVKAKKVCINKIYDLNEPLASNILALEMNKLSLNEIELEPLAICREVFRGLQFFHDCGYLYRNLHPAHVMMSFEGNIVLLDLKLMRRFTDVKGKLLEVRGSAEKEGISEFVSNARLRGVAEGRKDDMECLGYLALYLIEGKLPWNVGNMVQVRSKVTLQNLYGRYPGLLEFMISVHRMATEETPDYDALYHMIA